MERKNFHPHRMIILLILCMIIASCCGTESFTIVPIREAEFRSEHTLPLDNEEIKKIVEFIADGGVNRDDGFQAGVEYEHFRKFLQLFTEEANLTYGTFIALPELKEFINTEKAIKDVIDARKEKGAYQENRYAYRYKDFWFVFWIDTLRLEDGSTIREVERKFSRMIVMQVLDRAERTK